MHSTKLVRKDPVYIPVSKSSGSEVSRPEIPYPWQLIAWVSLMVVILTILEPYRRTAYQ